jgi:NAD(P)-dependent dehydrogenase (short-subunit alcohol dehydrogenase family)
MGPGEIFDLTGKVALVTGATRGIGNSMARGLALAGADVVVTGRKQDACDAAAKEIAERTGRQALGVACHMGDWDQIEALVARAYERFDRLDVLVNNAGINPGFATLENVTREFWDKVYDVNLKGPMRLAALVAPRMGEAGGGSIVNVITVGAYFGGAGVGVYTSAKAALLNLTRVMATEWAPVNVRVNALAPGPFATDMMKGAESVVPGFSEGAAAATLQKRVADPDEIIGSVLYLASDASSYVTGSDLIVAGGMR